MAFVTKDWQDSPSTSTPLSAAALEDLETRLGAYSDRFAAGYQTSLPGSPVDGDVIAYGADPTNGVIWLLRYRSAASGSYKWEYIGGAPLAAEVATSQTRSAGTYGDLATTGPTVTTPLAGDYDVEIDSYIEAQVASATALTSWVSYAIGGTGAVDADGIQRNSSSTAFEGDVCSRTKRKSALAASTALQMKYKGDSVNNTAWRDRRIAITPVRVG